MGIWEDPKPRASGILPVVSLFAGIKPFTGWGWKPVPLRDLQVPRAKWDRHPPCCVAFCRVRAVGPKKSAQ